MSAAENSQVKETQKPPSAAMKGDRIAVHKPLNVLRKAGVQFYSAITTDKEKTVSVLGHCHVSGGAPGVTQGRPLLLGHEGL
mmetsp:Transcript_13524/g.40889  ORF Transcript_13524/g.40889 Transcript_13524/m.40889 type:complete len:82 (-) Transcript_13524:3246-3491(-)